MKFTRSLPANAMARAKVPKRTITRKILILKASRICDIMVNAMRHPHRIVPLCVSIMSRTSGVMKDDFPNPATRRKYIMAVMEIPPNMPTAQWLF